MVFKSLICSLNSSYSVAHRKGGTRAEIESSVITSFPHEKDFLMSVFLLKKPRPRGPRSRRLMFIKDRDIESFRSLSFSEAVDYVRAREKQSQAIVDCVDFPCGGACGALIDPLTPCRFYRKRNGLQTACCKECSIGRETIEVSPESAVAIFERQAQSRERSH